MTHVFVSPHPDDAALSCGGLIAGLRELGHNVTIITVFGGGPAAGGELTDYQRTSLGFGTKALWPNTEAFRRTAIENDLPVPVAAGGAPAWMAEPDRIAITQERANTQARQFWQRAAWLRNANVTNAESPDRPLPDTVPGQGSNEAVDWEAAEPTEIRQLEDERYAWFAEASIVQLDLPDAVFRGYDGDDQLLGEVREDDEAPFELLRREILRLEPQLVYFPLAVGNHVDHQLCREVGLAMLAEGRRWVMPGPDLAGRMTFYEDFPYAWWSDFEGPARWTDGRLELPPGVELQARYADISDSMERKAAGLRVYASQVQRLFDGERGMLDDLAGYHARVALAGGVEGYAERYWSPVRA
ncbi:MAG TPA: PIG-L family deacetylase [Candidatus Limnocylindrales bacterium]|nr:PIG-L family deacetylase [Candidatus Limnocylindrales bacterium]